MGETMKVEKLIDIISKLSSYEDDELTIYVVEPWTCDSNAIIAQEPEEGGIPPEAKGIEATYFIEIFIAIDVLEGWKANVKREIPLREQCERLIYYAIYDA